MKTSDDFASILEQIIDSGPAFSAPSKGSNSVKTSYSAGWESALDPFGLSELIGKTSVFPKAKKKYVSTFVRPAHAFNAEQKQAFEQLQSWATDLKSNFSKAELRSQYRKAVLKTHPDQGGSSENFWAAKKSYELLKSLVTNNCEPSRYSTVHP